MLDHTLLLIVAAIAIAHFVFGKSAADIYAWAKGEGLSLRAKLKALEARFGGSSKPPTP